MSNEDKQKKASVSAKVTSGILRRIYDNLDYERLPFEANVRKIGRGIHEITIHADADNIEHFKSMLV